jgi:hypothetical protein
VRAAGLFNARWCGKRPSFLAPFLMKTNNFPT